MNIKNLIDDLGIHPNKKLGQNFLIEENAAKKIIEWANLPKGCNVVEIGPGLGAISYDLAKAGHPLILIEIDNKIAQYMKREFANQSNVTVMHQDVLEVDFQTIFPGEPFHIISNAPYSISTPIIEKALEVKERVPQMVFLFQEEVINRICSKADDDEYGRLSIWVQSQCDIERGDRIAKDNFFPKPDVESRLVRITPSKNPLIPEEQREKFLKFIGHVFRQRRKTLRNNLKSLGIDGEKTNSILTAFGITETVRAETLEIDQLYKIYQSIYGS
jgi:16S rRNA (adenine1518-N6/adenine1519-N6)-dimethyltransferase